ncbi:hypothetical protein CMMCAS04_03555 [Clavibacter michiganensis subsp. michiganensis]|nr:hypothetical protein CMMCAS04_03555 [Clavibacter michiganensis subsp. michiganensis]
MTASIRPSEIGPSATRKPSHQAAGARPRPRRMRRSSANAAASSSVISASHTVPKKTVPPRSEMSMGTAARIGYTHGRSTPTQPRPVIPSCIQMR